MTTDKCPKGHDGLEFVSGDYPSGVQMNGYKEYLSDEGYYCECCGRVYDVTDIEDETAH